MVKTAEPSAFTRRWIVEASAPSPYVSVVSCGVPGRSTANRPPELVYGLSGAARPAEAARTVAASGRKRKGVRIGVMVRRMRRLLAPPADYWQDSKRSRGEPTRENSGPGTRAIRFSEQLPKLGPILGRVSARPAK